MKWKKAVVNDLDSFLVTEVPVKLKNKYLLRDSENERLDIEQRLLTFKSKDSIYSLMEYFISLQDLNFLYRTSLAKISFLLLCTHK